MSRLAPLLLVWLGAALVGCSADTDPSRVHCTQDRHCPDDWYCGAAQDGERTCTEGTRPADDDDSAADDDDSTPEDVCGSGRGVASENPSNDLPDGQRLILLQRDTVIYGDLTCGNEGGQLTGDTDVFVLEEPCEAEARIKLVWQDPTTMPLLRGYIGSDPDANITFSNQASPGESPLVSRVPQLQESERLLVACTAGNSALYQLEIDFAPFADSAQNSLLGNLVFVPGSDLRMGCEAGRDDTLAPCPADETPAHDVWLSRGFWMMEREVTRGMLAEAGVDDPSSSTCTAPDCPADSLTYDQAMAFADAVGAAQGFPPCSTWSNPYGCPGWRLPTEAEWEHAARGRQSWAYAGAVDPAAVAVHGASQPEPGCSLPANAFGLCDLSGNLAEFVWDAWGEYSTDLGADPFVDPQDEIVTRGGAFWDTADQPSLRVAGRASMPIGSGSEGVGFRLVRTEPDVVAVPQSEGWMGCQSGDPDCEADEQPGRIVALNPYWLDRTEVTVDAYSDCIGAGACSEPDSGPSSDTGADCNFGLSGREDHPINCIDANQAEAYCAWAGGRLPTEAEWERAARGADAREWPWGAAPVDCDRAWFAEGGNPACDTTATTRPVATLLWGMSPYGALDLAGNVAEWISDGYAPDTYSTVSSLNPSVDPAFDRVVRGGSWYDPAERQRAYDRDSAVEGDRSPRRGFRCAYDP